MDSPLPSSNPSPTRNTLKREWATLVVVDSGGNKLGIAYPAGAVEDALYTLRHAIVAGVSVLDFAGYSDDANRDTIRGFIRVEDVRAAYVVRS